MQECRAQSGEEREREVIWVLCGRPCQPLDLERPEQSPRDGQSAREEPCNLDGRLTTAQLPGLVSFL